MLGPLHKANGRAASALYLLGLAVLLFTFSLAKSAEPDAAEFLPYEDHTVTAITISGNRSTHDFVIEREIFLEVGQAFKFETLINDYRRLENLNIFGTITIVVQESGAGVDLHYSFREMPSYLPYLAFRFTEQNGWSVGPALSAVNLFGRAIRVSGRMLFGGTTTFIVDMTYPYIDGKWYRLTLDLDANYLERDDTLNEFYENSYELSPWFFRYLNENRHVLVGGLAGYFRMEADRDSVTIEPDRGDDIIRIAARAGYDSRDSWRVPHKGWQNEIELWRTFWDANYWSTNIDIRRFQPVAEKHTAVFTALTSLASGTVGEDVPSYFQYRMGGANSIRGHDIDVLGRELFGKNQFIGTFEYWFNVLPLNSYNFFRWSAAVGIQLAAFADTGIAWNTSDEFSNERWKSGYGVGVRLLVPGSEMVRFDVGFNRQGDVFFHFGNWFKWTAQRFRLR